jgi:hypothetical protein
MCWVKLYTTSDISYPVGSSNHCEVRIWSVFQLVSTSDGAERWHDGTRSLPRRRGFIFAFPFGAELANVATISQVSSRLFGLPCWMFTLVCHRLRKMRQAHKQLTEFMRTQALDRKKEVRGRDTDESDRKDIFTMLVRANETEEGKFQLGDDELVRTCSSSFHSAKEPHIIHRSGIFLSCYWPGMVESIPLA